MTRGTLAMFALTGIAVVLWMFRFVPTVGIPIDLADFFGGMAIGFGIGAVVAWGSARL
jgi:hypothetical protein